MIFFGPNSRLHLRAGLLCVLALGAGFAFAQQPPMANDPILTMAPHSEIAPYWVSGQANSIFQMHGHFHSPYAGANSLQNIFETKASEVATLYLGYQ